jgi:hypothetical protein
MITITLSLMILSGPTDRSTAIKYILSHVLRQTVPNKTQASFSIEQMFNPANHIWYTDISSSQSYNRMQFSLSISVQMSCNRAVKQQNEQRLHRNRPLFYKYFQSFSDITSGNVDLYALSLERSQYLAEIFVWCLKWLSRMNLSVCLINCIWPCKQKK